MAARVSIQEAETRLSRLVEEVAAGAEIIITKAGKPMARLAPISAPTRKKRLGLLAGKIKVPNDFNAARATLRPSACQDYFTANVGTATPLSMNVHFPSAQTARSISIRLSCTYCSGDRPSAWR